MAGWNRGVGGKHTLVGDLANIDSAEIIGMVAKMLAGMVEQLQSQQTRMTFIHVVLFDRKVHRLQNPGAADPEDNFLLEAQSVITAIKVIREMAILIIVAGNVGVEKQHRNFTTGRALNPVEPGLDLDIALFNADQRLMGE